MRVETREALEPGRVVAGAWAVERPLAEVGGLPAVLARGVESGRAILFILADDAPAPTLEEDEAARWGSVRRIVRDDELGRVVIDEIPEGALLAERLALGMPPAAGVVEELAQRMRACHRAGHAHGQLAPDRIVLGAEGPVVAGWGVGGEDVEARKARDLAWIARLTALAGPSLARRAAEPNGEAAASPAAGAVPPARPAERATPLPPPGETREVAPTEPATGVLGDAAEPAPSGPVPAATVHRLQAAIVSSHLATLQQALEQWEREGGAADDPLARRGRDALTRLERKIEGALAEARQRLASGDPLGAVTPCREAIRLGAEAEAEPLLATARRQARQIVAPRQLPSPRVLALAAGGGLVVLLLVAAIVVAVRGDSSAARLRSEAEVIAASRGDRSAVVELLARRDRLGPSDDLDTVLGERLRLLPEQERTKIAKLHRESVAQGARPREAEQVSAEALAVVSELANAGLDEPGLRARLEQAFVRLDRAAALYRTAGGLRSVEAARAVDGLLATDPAFGGARP